MFGRTLLAGSTPALTRVSADNSPTQKPGGITIDWTTVAAPGSDTTLPDGSVIKSGNKFLRYGQVMTKIAGGTNTLTSTATGGTTVSCLTKPYCNSAWPAARSWRATIRLAVRSRVAPSGSIA
jgi:hypothetical protein